MTRPGNTGPLTKHRRDTDREGVIVPIKVRRGNRLVWVLFEFIPILIGDGHSYVARRRDRRWQLGLRSLAENYRQVIQNVEPRHA